VIKFIVNVQPQNTLLYLVQSLIVIVFIIVNVIAIVIVNVIANVIGNAIANVIVIIIIPLILFFYLCPKVIITSREFKINMNII
jgi:hypothetical protein